MKLTTEIVQYSSVVGRSVIFNDEAGACAALVMISVPNPRFDYREIADEVAPLIAAAPDLLAALIETLEIANRNEDGPFAERARAAISKATVRP